MPEISRFLGIVITMYYEEHDPPHFHVRYNEFKAAFSIENLTLLHGKLPPRVIGLVLDWASQHKKELLADWQLAKNFEELKTIKPLE